MKTAWLKNVNPIVLLVSLVASILAVLAIWYWNYLNHINTFNSQAAVYTGRKLPDASLIELKSGDNFSGEVRQGNVLLIYLVSTCNACEKQLKSISENSIQLNPHTKIFGIMFEDADVVAHYVKKHNVGFPVLLDKNGKLLNDLNLRYFPTNLELRNGVIEKTSFGVSANGNLF
ncbi:MAG: hypothetical protein C4287_23155 [Leptolyngbya sp. ERB_1_2]